MTIGITIAFQTTSSIANPSNRGNFIRSGTSKTDFPPSSGKFVQRNTERSGPVDLNASVQSNNAQWRMCRECGYNGEDPKPFKAVGLRASFQPIGGTFSYRF